jgi:hypothetical protein
MDDLLEVVVTSLLGKRTADELTFELLVLAGYESLLALYPAQQKFLFLIFHSLIIRTATQTSNSSKIVFGPQTDNGCFHAGQCRQGKASFPVAVKGKIRTIN